MTVSRSILFCLGLILVVFISASQPRSVQADSNFAISLISTYTVTEDGRSTVEQTFTLTNRKPDIFATQYALETSSTRIHNVTVREGSKDLHASVVTTDQKTSIGINFPDNVVGEGKSRTFTVKFESDDAVIVAGNVLEVYVPKLSEATNFDHYEVRIVVPSRYGQPTRTSPTKFVQEEKNGNNIFKFSDNLEHGITALFGKNQAYHFTLRYFLENPTTTTGLMQIALPPDTSYQRIVYDSLLPPPRSIEEDADGNWIATYEMASQKSLEVVATGTALLSLSPLSEVPVPSPLSAHTSAATYWESNDPRIQELAAKYKTPRAIYDYVVSTLNYDYTKLTAPAPRLGAAQVLSAPTQAVCQEFTDLYIAIARAALIPARRATGYAFTNNNSRLRPLNLEQDVLHAWPEYYDSVRRIWIPVDPTWGKTTDGLDFFDHLDVNHLVFAYNGVSSTQPFGAGAYKRKDSKSHDVEIKVVDFADLSSAKITTSIQPLPFYNLPLGSSYALQLQNTSGQAQYQLPVTISATDNSLGELLDATSPSKVDSILPYQTLVVPFALHPDPWWRSGVSSLTLQVGPVVSAYEQSFGPLQPYLIFPAAVGISLVAGAIIAWSILVRRQPRRRSVRR